MNARARALCKELLQLSNWLAVWIPTQDEDEDVLGLEDEIRVQNYS